MEKKFESKFNKKWGIAVLTLTCIIAILLTMIFLNRFKVNTNVFTSETKKAMTYDEVKQGEEDIEGTDNVKFDAFFLRDLDGDGHEESIRGTCKKIGAEDTLYMKIGVQTAGFLKDAKITVNSDNFYLQTSLLKDNELKDNYIGNNIKSIEFNTLNSGIQKTLTGTVCSGDYSHSSKIAEAIGNNINKYGKVNNVILTGTYVGEDGTETQIEKKVDFNVDWYGEAEASVYTTIQNKNIESTINEEEGTIDLEFTVYTKEVNEVLNLKSNSVEGEIPELNGYLPINVEHQGGNAIFNYDETTRMFTINREADVLEDGTIIRSVSNDNNYTIKVTYPIEAYQSLGTEFLQIRIPVKTYYEGYNNVGEEFTNPYKSNVANAIITVNYEKPQPPIGTIYMTKFDITVGKCMYEPTKRYVVSKQKPLNMYNGKNEQEKEDTYTVMWKAFIGTRDVSKEIIMKETKTGKSQVSDNFVNIDNIEERMEDIVSNVGIYFNGADTLLGEEGWIKVYDEQTGKLLETFTKETWNKYTSNNPYKYELPVKHIRIETSKVEKSENSLYVYSIKEIDDEKITDKYEREKFDSLQYISSTVVGYLNGEEKEKVTQIANYEMPMSVASINISKNMISTQQTEKNEQIRIHAKAEESNNQVKWQNGTFLVKLPEEIIDVKINDVTINNPLVRLENYELIEQNGQKFIKILTKNEIPQTYILTIDVDITADQRIATTTKQVELYASNENESDYCYKLQDIYDVNSNFNMEENVNYTSTNISMVSPNSLLTNEVARKYDDNDSVVMSPQISDIKPVYGSINEEQTAEIGLQIKNNYDRTISEIKILGKIPFEGNTYAISGEDLGSTFTTKMQNTGIIVPEELQENITVYYSENENPDKDLNKRENGWKTKEQIENWDNIKTFIIDLENYVMDAGKELEFNYTVNIPNGLEFNKLAYSHHSVYFSLDTENGKYKTQVESNKLGFRIAEKYDLKLTKYQVGKDKPVSSAIYSIKEIREGGIEGEQKAGITNLQGSLEITNLYAERTYEIKEIKTPDNYEINEDVIRFIAHVDEQGRLSIDKESGNLKEDINVIKNEGENYKVHVKVEDEVKATVKITNMEQGTENIIPKAHYKIAGYNLPEQGKILTTDLEGKVTLKGISINEEYTLEEVKADGYYLANPVKFKVVNNDGNCEIEILEGSIANQETTEEDYIPTINIKLENEKMPTYDLEITKIKKINNVEEDNVEGATYLSGAKFKLYKGTKEIGEYVTNEEGKISITGLHQYESEKNIEQTYTLKEVVAPEGYAKSKDIIFKVENVDGTLKFIEELTEGQIAKTYTVEGNTVKVVVEGIPAFKLIKKDSETKIPLAGVKFAIYNIDKTEQPARNSNGEILGEKQIINEKEYYVLTTNESGEIIADLREGLYKAVEVEAPEKYDITNKIYYFGVGASRAGEHTILEEFNEDIDESKVKNISEIGIPEVQEIIIENERKEFKIKTDIKEIDGIKGGTISGEDENEYEKVKYGDSNTKEIKITPDENYEIIGITINGEEYQFEANADGTYVMPQFENMTEDKQIEVSFANKDNKIIINNIDAETNEKLQGATFKIDQIKEILDPENVKGDLTENGSMYDAVDEELPETIAGTVTQNGTYYFAEQDGKYIPTNINMPNTVANSYVPIDLSGKEGKFGVVVNAETDNAGGIGYLYATITENKSRPAYSSTTGRFMYVTNTQSAKDYVTFLEGGKLYYLHIGYQNGTGTPAKIAINSIRMYKGKKQAYSFIQNGEKYESNNVGKDNTTANSYIPIDLTDRIGKYDLTVNAEVSSKINHNYGYATITQSQTAPAYDSLTGRFVYISGEESAQDYTTELQGGKMYYLHFGYYKDASPAFGEDKFTINSVEVTLNNSELYHTEATTNSNGQAITQIPFGKYNIVQTKAPEGYELNEESITVEFRPDGTHEYTLENKKHGKVLIHHYKANKKEDGTYEYTEEKIADDELLEGKVNDKYSSTPHLNLEKYKLIQDEEGNYIIPENAIGTYTTGTVEINYYYEEKEVSITVHHYIEGTTTPVLLKDGTEAEDVKMLGKKGAEYTTTRVLNVNLAKEYELVELPKNWRGTYGEDDITVTYYYREVKREITIIKYAEDGTTVIEGAKFKIRAKDSEELLDEEIYVTDEEGKITVTLGTGTYEIIEIEVPEGYVLPENPVTQLEITRKTPSKENINIISEREKGTVTVHHYLEGTTENVPSEDGTLIEDEKKSGSIGEPYVTKASEMISRKYELVEVPENSSGQYAKGNIEVTYYYKIKDTSVLVHYYKAVKNEDGTYENTEEKLSEDVLIKGNVDDLYQTVEAEDIPEYYELVEEPVNKEGIMALEQTEVTYYYKIKEYEYIVNYLEKDTGKVLNEQKESMEEYGTEIQVSNEIIDIAGYKYDSADKESIVIKKENNIINIYYVKDKFEYVIEYYFDGIKDNELTETKIATYEENIEECPDKVKQGYEFDRVENLPLQISSNVSDNVIKVYYRIKDSQVVVKYVDKETEEEISEQVIKEGKVFDTFDITEDEKEIEGYTLVESPETLTGEFTEETQELVFYYAKNTKVIVNYIDKNTDEILETVEQDGKVGDVYTAIVKNFDKYVLEESPENETVTMTRDEIVLNYYYVKISAGVVEKHIDIKTNEILASEVHEGNEGDEYKIEPKTIEGYDVVKEKIPTNAEGKMEVDSIEVRYYYIRKMTVTVEYIDKITEEKISERIEERDENGNIIYKEKDSTEVITGHEGDTYKAEEKKFEKYNIVKEMYPNNAEGTMEKSTNSDGTINTEIKVKYYYVKKAEVIEKHVDIKTGDIIEEVRQEGQEKDPYKTQPKEIEGYDVVEEKLPDNAEGEMNGQITVTYYYIRKAKVVVEYIDKATGEKINEIIPETNQEKDSTEEIEGHEGDEYETKEKIFKDYKLKETAGNTRGKMRITVSANGKINTTTYVKYYYEKVEDKKPEVPTNQEKPSDNKLNESNGQNQNNGNNTSNTPNSAQTNNYNNKQNKNGANNDNNSKSSSSDITNKTQQTQDVQDSNIENAPYTGDMLPIVAGVTVICVIILNIILGIIHKKCKEKRNFIK